MKSKKVKKGVSSTFLLKNNNNNNMSCLVTKGRLVPCKSFVGGIYKVWLINFGEVTPVLSGYTVTSLSATTEGASIYEYELKGQSKFTQEMTSSRDNGTTFVTQTLTLDLQGADADTNNEIKLLAYGRPSVIVQDNYGNAWFGGRLRGFDLTTGVLDNGAALGDKYGYTLTLVAMENEYANFLSGSTIANAFAGMESTPTIVKGS